MTKKYLSESVDWKKVWNFKNLLQIFVGICLAVLAMKGFNKSAAMIVYEVVD
jgi:hypothetical protein